jgi:hypothetical protein
MLARKWLEQGAFKCRRYRRAPSLRAGNGSISAARRTPITARDPNRCKAGIVLAVMAFHQPCHREVKGWLGAICCALATCDAVRLVVPTRYKPQPLFPTPMSCAG